MAPKSADPAETGRRRSTRLEGQDDGTAALLAELEELKKQNRQLAKVNKQAQRTQEPGEDGHESEDETTGPLQKFTSSMTVRPSHAQRPKQSQMLDLRSASNTVNTKNAQPTRRSDLLAKVNQTTLPDVPPPTRSPHSSPPSPTASAAAELDENAMPPDVTTEDVETGTPPRDAAPPRSVDLNIASGLRRNRSRSSTCDGQDEEDSLRKRQRVTNTQVSTGGGSTSATAEAPVPPSMPIASREPEFAADYVATRGSKAKAADYTGNTFDVLRLANREYEVYILCKDAFPEPHVQRTWMQSCWEGACRTLRVDIILNERLRRVMNQHGSRIRGEVVRAARPEVKTEHGFRSEMKPKIIAENARLSARLLTPKINNFLYRNPKKLNGYFNSKLLEPIFRSTVFASSPKTSSLGAVYAHHLNPVPLPMVALVYTAIRHCVEEWQSGSQADEPFTEDKHKVATYQPILKLAREWDGMHATATKSMRRRWYTTARQVAGVADHATDTKLTISAAAKQKAVQELENHTGDTESEAEEDDGEGGDSN